MNRLIRMLVALVALVSASHAGAQTSSEARTSSEMAVPWGPGERAVYDVKFGPLKVGTGSMEVAGRERVRGQPTWHTVFKINGGTFFYRVDDTLESWFTTDDLSSLRFVQDLNEGSRDRQRRFEIYPQRQMYVEEGKEEEASVSQPLDDGSFLYFVRTVPLEVGKTYEYNRYFKPDRNPVKIRVLRKERIEVPAGTFDAVVVQPIIKAKGVFSENGEAEVWLSDDERRIMLQMKSKLSFGSLNLYLRSYSPPTAAATSERP